MLTVPRTDTLHLVSVTFLWLDHESGMDYHMSYTTVQHTSVFQVSLEDILLPLSNGLAPHSQVAPPTAFLMTKLARAK